MKLNDNYVYYKYMENLSSKLSLAKTDARQMDLLIREYTPFIKSEIAKTDAGGLEYDNKLSLGMLVFMNCARQYNETRGGFIAYASVCIRNRLLDEARRQKRENSKLISLGSEESGTAAMLENIASIEEYDKEREQAELREEIHGLSAALKDYGLSYTDIARGAPKQKRSRMLCAQIAAAVYNNEELLDGFKKTQQLPKAKLAQQLGISPKTIEKYRRYIVSLILIGSGGYPGIKAYIPTDSEVNR